MTIMKFIIYSVANATYFIQDRSYLMQEGDLVFIDKNKLHKTLDANDLPHERILLSFDEPG